MDNRENIGEIELTKKYIKTLKKVYQEKGVLSAVRYELSSTWHSFKKRMEGIFDGEPSKYQSYSDEDLHKAMSRKNYGHITPQWDSWRIRQRDRKRERVKGILRFEKGLVKIAF